MDDEDDDRALLFAPGGIGFDGRKYLSGIIQSVHSIGYAHIAERLEQETDTASSHQPLKFANLRSQFLGGFWEKSAETLLTIVGLTEKQVSDALFIIFRMYLEERLALDSGFCPSKVLGNKYIDHLSTENYIALNDIALNFQMPDGLNLDALYCPLVQRRSNMEKLNDCLPVVFQSTDWHLDSVQIYSCLYHNTKDMFSLRFDDHSCHYDRLPTNNVQAYIYHTERFLCVKFSHNGQYLASASADYKAMVWEVRDGWKWNRRYVLRGHEKPVTCVSWSPNDKLLVTCASGEKLKIWDACTGKCTGVISSEHVPILRSCEFLLSDQIGLVYGTSRSIRLLRNGCDSELFSRSGARFTIDDFVVTPNGRKLIYKDGKRTFIVTDIGTGYCESFEEEWGANICGFSVSDDSEILLLSLSNDEIHVWDLKRLTDKPLTYWGYNKATCVTRPCFGGVDSRFLACGTDDGKVWIWNRRNGRPIAILRVRDNPSAVRCVSWNPQRPQMLASAGDNCGISIWGPQSYTYCL